MKKLFMLSAIVVNLLVISQVALAQNAPVTTKTATKARGYTVINEGESIQIFKYAHKAHAPKEANKYSPKYYFTTGSSDVLQQLTKTNLKSAFPDNHKFHDALDATINTDADLISYDSYHKMYKINWILKNNQ